MTKYRGEMPRAEARERLKRLEARLGLAPKSVKIGRISDSKHGVVVSFTFQNIHISRSCDSQATQSKNLACLVIWLSDLVRNIERRIETFEEAFYTEGARLLPEQAEDPYAATKANLYRGTMTKEEALGKIERTLSRLSMTQDDVKVSGDFDTGEAWIRMRLSSGRIVEKKSYHQPDFRTNLCALSLWLQTRAKNYERGIETDLNRLFAANLLPPGDV